MIKSLTASDNEFWKLFSGKKPKGFGKFYEENKEQKSDSSDKPKSSSSENKPPPKSDNESPKSDDATPKPEQDKNPKRTPPPKPKYKNDFSFNLNFSPEFTEGPNKDIIFTTAMIATALAIGIYSYYSYLYQEISWKDLSK